MPRGGPNTRRTGRNATVRNVPPPVATLTLNVNFKTMPHQTDLEQLVNAFNEIDGDITKADLNMNQPGTIDLLREQNQ